MTLERPAIGQWYKEAESAALFEVVAIDDHSGCIEVQYLDGEIAKFDTETWGELTLIPAVEPEDWRAPYELSDEDGMDPDEPLHPAWGNPVNSIEPDGAWELEDY
jgi:hypothetical protein